MLSIHAIAQSGAVFSWTGGSGNWHDYAQWTTDGMPSTKIPTQDDIVFISSEFEIEITLSENAFAEALYTTGKGKIHFAATKNIRLEVASSFVLSKITSIDEKVNVKLHGTGKKNYYNSSKKLDTQIDLKSKKNYKSFNNLAKAGGSCPYFTIVANPVAPTCNGFNNGIASVEPIADGVGPFTYQWITGPSTRQWNNLGAGTYTVIIFDVGQGLLCNIDVFVNEPGPLTVFSMNASAPLCADVCNGSAAPIIIGGNGGYELNWSSGENGFTASLLCPTFTLNVEDLQGCIYDTTYTFSNTPDTIKFVAAITDIDCFGNNNGAIDASISGGVGAFILSWTGPSGFTASTEDISGLEPGDYTLQVEDANNCLADSTFTILENPSLLATSLAVDNACGGAAEGSISIIPTGGLAPYSYAWTGPNGFIETAQNITNLESGLYELTITDAALCTFTIQVNVDEPAAISVSFTSDNVLCAGGDTGSASATANGGTPGYTYSWEGPNAFTQSGPGISNITAGVYAVTVTDANLCLLLDSIEIFQPDSLKALFTVGEITCNNGNDGSINTLISGGNPPYNTAWIGPGGFNSSNADISGLLPGSYSLTIIDFNNCQITETVVIDNPASIQIAAVITSSTCALGNDGAIDITASGGTDPYNYAWAGPAGFFSTTEDISNRPPGNYTVTVTDANLCTATGTYTIDTPTAISATFTKVNASCFDAADGSITTTPSGGVAPYSFLWVGPSGFISMNQNPTGLVGGVYSVQITDGNGCVGYLSVEITQPPKINITGPVSQVTCFGGSNGAIDLIVFGGNPPYTFSWVGPDGFTTTTKNILGLVPGEYTVTVTDAILCTRSRTFTITQPNEININATITDVICSGDADGSINISVSDGVEPYTFAWTGPSGFNSSSQNISGIGGGLYNLTVTDANSCTVSDSYTVGETVIITLDATITDVVCFGEANGAIAIVVQGGAEPYVHNWIGSNGFTSSDLSISDLEPGNYDLTLTDDNGCTVSQAYSVDSPDDLGLTIDAVNIACFGETNGTLTANVTGGTLPYNYSWTGPDGFTSTQEAITNLAAGNYSVTIVDGNNCEISGNAEIIEPTLLEISADVTQPGCLVDDGELIVTPSGGTAAVDYAYSWKDEVGTEIGITSSLSNLGPGTYIITITDDRGCTVQDSILLERNTFDIVSEIIEITCFNNSDASIELTPTNGTSPFTYSWTGPNGFVANDSLIENLETGQYDVVVEDAGGCVLNNTFDIDQPQEIGFNPVVTPESCPGEVDGAITLAISGGNPGFLINWIGPDGFTSNSLNIDDLAPGTYTASITDVNGCSKDTIINVANGNDFTIALNGTNPFCAGDLTGSIDTDVLPNSGTPGVFTFAWSGPNSYASANQNITNLNAGFYLLTVTSQEGCTLQDSLELFMPDSIIVDITVVNSSCLASDGSASVSVSGGVGTLTIRWLNSDGDEIGVGNDIFNLSSGIYTAEVSDDAGCIITETVVISDNSGSVSGLITSPICSGGDNGAIDINVVGGVSPFTFSWSDGNGFASADEDINDITAGEYTVTVQDDNGCIYTASFTIADPPEISVNESVSQVSCNGGDGEISLVITNANPPITVTWNGPDGFIATGENITNLEIGTYIYEITDANTCSVTGQVEVTAAEDIIATAELENILCGGDNSGSIDLSVVGGISPLSYSWTDTLGFTSNSQDIADVTAGTYTIVITDAKNCSITEIYTLTENTPISATFTVENPDCAGDNGSIAVVLSGGVVSTDYFISWTDFDGNPLPPSANLTNLGVGTYVFSGFDDNGCSIDTTILLTNPDATITAIVSNEICPLTNNGTIDISIAGVEEPYTIDWAGPDSFTSGDEDLIDLAPGIYSYLITGFDGCEYTGTFTVDPANTASIISEITHSCFGQNSGSILLTVSGVNSPFDFSWTGPNGFTSQDEDVENLEAGNYQLSITDSNACLQTIDFEILVNPEILVDVSTTENTCFGDSLGTINLVLAGGVAPLIATWSGPDGFSSNSLNLTNLVSGDYILNVTDSTGCTLDSLIAITHPDEILAEETFVSAGCSSSGSLGMIELLVSGGTPGYSVAWTGPDGFTSVDFFMVNLQPGIYNYAIADANACEITGEIEILDVTPFLLDISFQQITCYGLENGSASAAITGGLEPYTILWSGPNGFTSSELNIAGLMEGDYTLLISDSAGCSNSQGIEIVNPDSITIEIDETIDTNCNTSFDGSISITASGGTEPYSFEWSGPNVFTSSQEDLVNLLPGDYTLQVQDSAGCEASANVIIDFLLEIAVNAGIDLSLCADALPGTVAGSGTNVDEFSWIDFDENQISDSSLLTISETPGMYSYIFVGSNGICEAFDTLNVQVLTSPLADAGPDKEVFAEEVFAIGGSPTSNVDATFLWSPNPTSSFNTTNSNPSGFLLESTDFIVTVTDLNGCVATDTVFVNVLPDLIITSGFTPNNDGVNDTWVIDNMELFPNNAVHVFNRWGQSIFEQESYNNGNAWDGTFEGDNLPVGTYYYTIELNDNRFPEPFTGPITINR